MHLLLLAATTGGVPAAPGYDIFLGAGQSNKFNGASFDGALDVSDSRIYQILNHTTPGALSGASANDPLDWPNDTVTGLIGHDVHFVKDYYLPNALQSPRKVIIVPYALGGTSVSDLPGPWGAPTGPLTAVIPNTLLPIALSRVNSALAQTGANAVKAVLWHQGEWDYVPYGNGQIVAVLNKFRFNLLRAFLYFRQNISPTVPIVVGRLTAQSIDAGAALYAHNGLIVDGIIRATVNRMKYSGCMDSQSPTALGTSDIHFTAAEQRLVAGRYWTAYQAALTNTLSTPTTWDALDYPRSDWEYPAGYTLSNGNLDASGDANSGWKTIWATNPKTTGKVYAEFKVIAVASTFLGFIGFSNSDMSFTGYIGDDGNGGPSEKSAGMWDTNGQAVKGYTQVWAGNFGARSVNDVYMLALDIPAGKAWIGKNGTWGNSGDPAAGTNPWCTGLVDGEMHFLSCSIYAGTGNTWRLQAAATNQTYPAPTGFTAWD